MTQGTTMKEHLARVQRGFAQTFGCEPEAVFFAPGRVNLIGEHTDYNGGHVFPCAISLGTFAAAARRADGRVRLHSFSRSAMGVMEFALPPPGYTEGNDWTNYPLGVIHVLLQAGHAFPGGLDILFDGTLPSGAGLSSSASIEVLTAVICNALFTLRMSLQDMALLSQKAENEYVGVRCGIMDQFAVAMGREHCAILLNCDTLEYRYSPLELGDCRIVLVNTNKKHSLASSQYNVRRAQCEAALADLRAVRPELPSLGALTREEFDALAPHITDSLAARRARHAVYENRRVLEAVQALEQNDLRRFGELMHDSHVSLRDDFEVSCPELDLLAELAWKEPGVVGARMTGGGFGGCTVNLVSESRLEAFKRHIGDAYTQATGLVPDFYVADTAGGASRQEAI